MTQKDRDLINSYVKDVSLGSKTAFENLYNLVKPPLRFILIRRHNNREDVEEIIDDVFETVIKESKNLVFYTNCYKWIIKIAINKINNHIRTTVNRNNILKAIPFEVYTMFNERKAHIIIEIKKLPTIDLQYLIIYRYFCKMKISEIALAMNMSKTTIYRELEIARNILKEKLK